ncbi:Phospholipase/carboxylesterase/thioesterase [Acrodontium crateriforme]|uniref:Acyl-protein thioesterase 1 n=1 Tax=Acrodontium crateriforme TaxID=150365 RepID=A0AAQ3M799_9PEZI|nr:Phospholipase/carboxylesterase/thioesterase [Acrodontium crateriforme]
MSLEHSESTRPVAFNLPSTPGREDPIYKPAIEPCSDPKHSAAFIFNHGLADSAAAIENVADQFQQGGRLPWMSWILPNAKFNHINMDTAWFIPNGLPALAPSRPELVAEEDETGMLESVAYLESVIDAVVATGIPPRRIVLGGFSQGCAMSLLTHLTSSKYSGKLAGIVGLLGFLPLSDSNSQRIPSLRESAGLPRTVEGVPMFLARGTKDEFVPKRVWEYSLKAVQDLGVQEGDLEVREYPIRHTINGAVLQDVCFWLEKVVPSLT